MRVAVISDIHANLHALEAVLAAVAEDAPDAVWCLGDLVGYGPRPNACCALVAERADVSLIGNHDLGVLGRIPLEDFSPDAAESARWTQEVLDGAARAYLEPLEPALEAPDADAALYHASPRDPVWDYVLGVDAVVASFELTTAPVILVGHSHVALAVSLVDGRLDGGLAPAETEVDLSRGRCLLNPGSVGQPRDGDPRAAYLLLDLAGKTARFRRVTYPVEATQREIEERGLPRPLAERLAEGI